MGAKKRWVINTNEGIFITTQSTVGIRVFRRCNLRLASYQTQRFIPCGSRFRKMGFRGRRRMEIKKRRMWGEKNWPGRLTVTIFSFRSVRCERKRMCYMVVTHRIINLFILFSQKQNWVIYTNTSMVHQYKNPLRITRVNA